jgi:hypothetical protein
LKQHKNIHKTGTVRQKYICFIDKCKKSYFYICTLKKHIISSHKSHYNKIIKNFPDRNFFDVINYLRKNTTFPFINFKEETVNNTNDITENENVGRSESFDLVDSCKVDIYFLFVLMEKYLLLQNVFNSCINNYIKDYYNFVKMIRLNEYFNRHKLRQVLKGTVFFYFRK